MSLDRIRSLDKASFNKNIPPAMPISDTDIKAFENVFGPCKIPRGNKSIEFRLKTPVPGQLYSNVYRAFKYPDGYRVRTLANAPSLIYSLYQLQGGGKGIMSLIEFTDYEEYANKPEYALMPAMVTYRGYFLNFVSPEEIKEFLEERLLSQHTKAVEKSKKYTS